MAIARALVNEPDLLMADEPTGALDSKTGQEIMDLFLELNRQGRTVVMVTHDPKLAELGSRTITISDGKIVKDHSTRDPSPRLDASPSPKDFLGLSLKDLVRIGVREGLLAHKLRTFLTMLGVLIGVASVISMSSFSESSKKKQADQIRELGVNLIKVMDQRLEGESLSQVRIQGSAGLTETDADHLWANIKGIRAMAALREVNMNAFSEEGTIAGQLNIFGVEGDLLKVNNLKLASGRWFEDADQERRLKVAVIGAGVLQDGPKEPGRTLVLGGQTYRVIGVLKDKRVDTGELEMAQGNDSNLHIYLPLSTVAERLQLRTLRSALDEIHLQVEEEDQLFKVGQAVRRTLLQRHRGVEDFDIVIPFDMLKAKQQSQRLLSLLSLGICAISLLVGGIGIMNIMLASVSERMKEIGIRRAIGATQADIRNQFLCESVLISFAGSLVGIALALVLVVIVNPLLSLPIVFSPIVVILAIVLAIGTGVGFGYTPANNAAHQNVIEILRSE